MKRSWLLVLLVCIFFAGCAHKQVKSDLKPLPAKKAVFWPFSNVPLKK